MGLCGRVHTGVQFHVRRPLGRSAAAQDPGNRDLGRQDRSGVRVVCGWTLVLRTRALGAGPLRTRHARITLLDVGWTVLRRSRVCGSRYVTSIRQAQLLQRPVAGEGNYGRALAASDFVHVLFCRRTSGKFLSESISTLTSSFGNIRTYVKWFPSNHASTGRRVFSRLPSANVSRRSTGIGSPPGLDRKIAVNVVPDESRRVRTESTAWSRTSVRRNQPRQK